VVAAVPRRDAHARARAALERFGIADLAQAPVARLSAGQRRRVCLARAALADPAVLVADDPTAHLDSRGRLAFFELTSEIAERGGAALIASSDPALAAAAIRLRWRVLDLHSRTESPGAAMGGAGAPTASEVPNVVPFPIGQAGGAP
jgi:ABC-type lipoprotein export system ATPase subunit